MSAVYQISIPHLTLETATGSALELLQRAQHKLGFLPNMYRAMALVPGLLETYMLGYERFRSDPSFTPPEQEVVFLTISRFNRCSYCVAAHSFIADRVSMLPQNITDAIRDNRMIADVKLAALNRFVQVMVSTGGRPTAADAATFFSVGYQDRHILAILLAMAVKTISNFSNHISSPELDSPFTARAWRD